MTTPDTPQPGSTPPPPSGLPAYGTTPPAPYGATPPPAPTDAAAQAPYGTAPQTPYGAAPQTPYGAGPQTPYGAGPQAPYGTPYGQGPAPARPGNGMAVAGFVVALFGLLGAAIPLVNIGSIILGIVGAVLAGVGLSRSRVAGTGKGMAVTGLVVGVLTIVISVVINIVAGQAFSDAIKDSLDELSTSTASPSDGTGAETDSDVPGASRQNPVAIGTPITDEEWTVTINSVTVVDADKYGDTAAAGHVLLQVNRTTTYLGTDEQGESEWAYVRFIAPDGTTISTSDGSTIFIAEDAFDSFTTLYQGGSVTGNEIFEVPADTWQDGVLAVAPTVVTDDTFVSVR